MKSWPPAYYATHTFTTHRKRSSLQLIPIHALEERMRYQRVSAPAAQTLVLLWLQKEATVYTRNAHPRRYDTQGEVFADSERFRASHIV